MGSIVTAVIVLAMGFMVAAAASDGVDQVHGLPPVLWCAVLAFGAQWVAFGVAYLRQTETFYDLVGSLSFCMVVALGLLLSDPADTRSVLLAACVVIWAARLGSFLFLRIRSDGGDRRFDKLKTRFLPFLTVWTLQGFWVIATASCALAAISSPNPLPLDLWAAAGSALWLLGFGMEVIADRQKRIFRRDPENSGRFIDSGLWSISQHPNYFGEILLWAGVACIAFPVLQGQQLLTLLSPLVVVVLLTRVSGIPTLDGVARKRWGEDPRWQHYVAVTPVLVPWIGKGRSPGKKP
jgi:steroid 5-alpha reductase family enzyme